MAITKNKGRQEVISAYVDFDFAATPAPAAYPAIDLPVGAVVVGGDIVVDTAFTAATTAAIGDASVANRYLAATSIAATGRTALVPTGFVVTPTQPAVTLTIAGASPIVGAGRLRVDYIVRKRAAFTQG